MNMKILSLSSLLLVAGLINGSQREQYQMKYNEAKNNAQQAHNALIKAVEILYQTQEGKNYKSANERLVETERDDDYYKAQWLSADSERARRAKENLQKTPEYHAFQYLFKNYAYYATLEYGLRELLLQTESSFNDAPSTLDEDLINQNKEKIDSETRDFLINTMEDQERAYNELHSIIKEIEANNPQ
jgi:hypothetical protein